MTQQNALLNRLLVAYGAPRKDQAESRDFLAEYARHIGGFSFPEMSEAADNIIQTRKFKTWPTVAECLTHLRSVRERHYARELAQARAMQRKETTAPQMLSPAEQRAAEKFVDDCADGKIDMGLCHEALRKLAISMRARRLRRQQL